MAILIIGGGSIGKRHLRNLFSLGYTDICVVETNAYRAKHDIEDEFGVQTFCSLEDAFQIKKFSFVFVCSPSVYHLGHARYCAERGCDLFIEKPVSSNMVGFDDFLELTRKKNLITMVGSNLKFHPSYRKMKEVLESGVIGRILFARCQFGSYLPNWHPWEDHRKNYSANKVLGGGVLLDSHEFDCLTWFLGNVKKLVCFADRISDITVDTEDVAGVLLHFEDGAIGEIYLDYVQRFTQRDFEFFGEKGRMCWSLDTNTVSVKTQEENGERYAEYKLEEHYDMNTMFIEEMKYFLDCVKTRKQTMTSIEVGGRVLRLIMAAKESAQTSQVIRFI